MRDNQRFAVIIACFIIGFVFAILIQIMVQYEVIPYFADEPLMVRGFQFIVILTWTIIGVIIASTQ